MILGMDPWVFLAWIGTILAAIACVIYGLYDYFVIDKKSKSPDSKKTKKKEDKQMDVIFFILFMALFTGVFAILGYFGFKKTKTAEDYYVAGRGMGAIVLWNVF